MANVLTTHSMVRNIHVLHLAHAFRVLTTSLIHSVFVAFWEHKARDPLYWFRLYAGRTDILPHLVLLMSKHFFFIFKENLLLTRYEWAFPAMPWYFEEKESAHVHSRFVI